MSDIEGMLTRIWILLAAVLFLLAVLLVVTLWERFVSLPALAKTLLLGTVIFVALALAALLIEGFTEQLRAAGVPTTLEDASMYATDLWYQFDGFTRTAQGKFFGGMLLVMLVILFLLPD